jgi:hypothetical protein
MSGVALFTSRSQCHAVAPETARSSARVLPEPGGLERGPLRDVAIQGGSKPSCRWCRSARRSVGEQLHREAIQRDPKSASAYFGLAGATVSDWR